METKQVQYFHFIFPENGSFRIKVEDIQTLVAEAFPNLVEQSPERLASMLRESFHWGVLKKYAVRAAPPRIYTEEQEWDQGRVNVALIERPEYLYKSDDMD